MICGFLYFYGLFRGLESFLLKVCRIKKPKVSYKIIFLDAVVLKGESLFELAQEFVGVVISGYVVVFKLYNGCSFFAALPY